MAAKQVKKQAKKNTQSVCFSLLVFKCQHFACKICLTFTGLMMRWKT